MRRIILKDRDNHQEYLVYITSLPRQQEIISMPHEGKMKHFLIEEIRYILGDLERGEYNAPTVEVSVTEFETE